MPYTPEQLNRAADYLASCANAEGEISGGYNWRTLAEIAGEDPGASSSGLGLFKALREAGRLENLPSIPGTYGHSIFRILPARRGAQADRNAQLLALRLASPKRSAAPQHDVDGLGLFDTVRQPSLF